MMNSCRGQTAENQLNSISICRKCNQPSSHRILPAWPRVTLVFYFSNLFYINPKEYNRDMKLFLLVLMAMVLTGCQQVIQPVVNVSDYVTGKVQIEQKKQADKTIAQFKCQELCQQRITNDGEDSSVGPCLSNEIIPDWVCDVAHAPRQPVDDDPRNQCSAFHNGTAHHFIEVDGN